MKKSSNLLLVFAFSFFCLASCGERNSKSSGNKDKAKPQFEKQAVIAEENPTVKIKPGHIVMMVSDLDNSQQFYEEHLDLHTTEEVVYDGLRRIFMSGSDNHHELVLLESRVAKFPHKDERQLQQIAFEVSSHDALVEYYQHIKETDIPHVIKDNQLALSIYFPDPDGVTVELYWDISNEPFGEKMWKGNQEDISEEAFLNPGREMKN